MSDEIKKLFNKGIANGLLPSDYIEVIEKLQKQNEILRKAVEFYGTPNHSYVNGLTTYTKYKNDSDRHEDCGYSLVVIGKTARQALEQCKELEDNNEAN